MDTKTGNIYSLNLKTETGQWKRKESGSRVIASPLYHQDKLYFGTSDTHNFCSMGATDADFNGFFYALKGEI